MHRKIKFVSIFALFAGGAVADEPLEEYRGTLGGHSAALAATELGSLHYLNCNNLDIRQARVTPKSTKEVEIQLFSDVYYEKPTTKAKLSRSVEYWKGIKVEKYNGKLSINGKVVDLSVMGSLDPRYITWTGSDASCLHVGWEPETIIAAIGVDAIEDARKWAKKNKVGLHLSKTNPVNRVRFSAPIGSEEEFLARLRAEPWVLDARRYGEGAGPDFAWVDYRLGTIYKPGDSQETVRRKLFDVIKRSFPSAQLQDSDFIAKRGYAFNLAILKPVSSIGLNEAEFKGYWLKANISILVNRQLSDDGTGFDHLEVEIADGWLPRWPETNKGVPPQKHTQQFHLDPNGEDRHRNFYVLYKLQGTIAAKLSAEWSGKAVIPDSE